MEHAKWAGSAQVSQARSANMIYLAEFFQRFSYWGLQSILVLYVTKAFFFSHRIAFGVFGTFTALTFIMSIFGGVLADRFSATSRLVIIGVLLCVAGNIVMGLFEQTHFYLSLSLMVCGAGLFLPNNANVLGIFYKNCS